MATVWNPTIATAKDLPPHEDDEPISTKATDCESNFSKSVRLMESHGEEEYAEILRKLQAKFVDWTAYLGVFAGGKASLDQRLRRHPRYQDLVLLVLDMLNINLIQTTVDPDDAGSDESSDDGVDRRKVELSGIQKSINELDRLAIYIRQSSTSSFDARVKAFGARKPAEISSFEVKTMLAVNGLYPEASESLRQHLSKSMMKRYTRLLYWKFHDKKLRADRRRDGQPRHTQPRSTPSHAMEPPQRLRSMEDSASALPKPEESKVSKGTTFLSGTVPSNAGSNLVIPPAEGEMPVLSRARASTVLRSGAKFPEPPQFKGEEDRKPCHLCRKIFSKADFEDEFWWRRHVNGDLFPFPCVSNTCSESPTFASRSEWTGHMERDHGVFWSRGPSIPNRDKETAPDPQATANLGQLVDICPLCCLPLEESGDARTGIHQSTVVPAPQTSNESPETLLLDSKKMESKTPSSRSKDKRSVQFDFTKLDSEPAGEGAGPPATNMEVVKADECGTQKTANTVTMMLKHIADHLQFLALLTPRLSTEKLAVGDVHAFPSSQASTSDRAPGKRSTLNNEFEFVQGDEVNEADMHGILQENFLEKGPRNEEVESTTPIDWSIYSIPMQTTKEDTVIEHMYTLQKFKHVDTYVKDTPALEAFFKDNKEFMQDIAKKAVDLANDPTTDLGSPEVLPKTIKVTMHQQVIYCDDSSSMVTAKGTAEKRWENQKSLALRIARTMTRILPDREGVALRFINQTTNESPSLDLEGIGRALDLADPKGNTPIGTTLRERILKPLVFNPLAVGKLKRPLLVSVLTDGGPTPEAPGTLASVIVECGNELERKGYPRDCVKFLIGQVGSSKAAFEFLDTLRDNPAIASVSHIFAGRMDDKFKSFRDERSLDRWLVETLFKPLAAAEAKKKEG
ncbi:uncharacterized protein BDZ99DRAFT_577208 [Mytilinidion resinicola]|uniref:VWFA domain-containing protein n=1 Tax=Mytilinidion resinicola TaxID=574789 RepID=A0A6A6Y013_9PEZI|nr:uncharacterized protein BDZ99DRAFT_577208 [Mytilinidion resinicola]KAF2801990.1 hypothetical protein BDZ99DRAFT_577208 [Mytilinidion resinicola]